MTDVHDVEALLSLAERAAATGSEVALEWWRRGADLVAGNDRDRDHLLIEGCRLAEQAIRDVIRADRPADSLPGEECSAVSADSELLWLIEPIDGSDSFRSGFDDWAVSVAAVDPADGTVVAGAVSEPVSGRMTVAGRGLGAWSNGRRCPTLRVKDPAHAVVQVSFGRPEQRSAAGRMVDALASRVRDLRMGGSAAVALAALATGRADAVWAPGRQPADGAAGLLLVAECGASVGDLTGPSPGRWPVTGDLLAAAPSLFEALRGWLAPVYGSAGPAIAEEPLRDASTERDVDAGDRVGLAAATITPYPGGPLIVRGSFEVCSVGGPRVEHGGGSVALCRCGRSAAKPFCDGSHKAVRRGLA